MSAASVTLLKHEISSVYFWLWFHLVIMGKMKLYTSDLGTDAEKFSESSQFLKNKK